MKHRARFFCFLLALTLTLHLAPLSVRAAELVDSGSCGENLTWVLTSDGTLTISGTGEMEPYPRDYPGWYKHSASVTRAVIGEGVTSVSECAFWDCRQLRWVDLPRTLGIVGERAFERCFSLELVTFTGEAPCIGDDAFKYADVMALYPAGDSSWDGFSQGHQFGGDISWVNGEAPVSLELISAPFGTNLALGETVDLRGILLRAKFADGSKATLKSGVVRLDSCDTSAVGVQTATVSYQGVTVTFPVYVHTGRSTVELDPATLPESKHSYQDNADDSQTVSYPGADWIELTFAEETRLDSADRLYLYTRDGQEFANYTAWEAGGITVTVPGDSVEIRLVSDGVGTAYGYKVVSARADMVDHVWEDISDQAPGCETEGWTVGQRCSICGYIKAGQIIPATGHSYGPWTQGEDGVWGRDCEVCGSKDTRTADYFYTEGGKSDYPQLSLEELRELYNAVDWSMQADFVSQPSWQPPYAVGRLTDACLDNLTAQVNFSRRLARLDPVAWDENLVELAQAASVVTAANGYLDHNPPRPEGMSDEIYILGALGAKSSNLCRGGGLMYSVKAYMDDSDSSNIQRVGHRRWLLAPGLERVGFGYTNGAAATYVMDAAFRGSDGTDFVAWPGGNTIFPSEFMQSHMAWSVSYGKDLCTNQSRDSFRVVLTRQSDGRQWEFSYDHADGYFNINHDGFGYGQAIIFRPIGIESYEGVYHVSITGIQPSDGSTETVIEYSVDFQSIKPHAHTPVVRNVKEASCTEEGYTGDTYCRDCGELLEVGEVIPVQEHSFYDNHCIYCGMERMIPGDANRDYQVTSDDAIYLLYHVLFGNDLYPVAQSCDVNKDGRVDSDDAIYILYATLFGQEQYPLK